MHTVIIGNGVTGINAALRLRELRPDARITVISGESTYHYSRPALMYVFMGHMRYADTKPYPDDFWEKQRLELLRDWVVGLDPQDRRLRLHRGGEMAFDQLLLATGSKTNRFGWPGQDLEGVQGLYDLMDLRLLYENTRRCEHAVIVGGGLIGIELAEMLHSRNIHVSLLVREKSYWNNVLPDEESAMVNRAIEAEGMDLRLETNLEEILDDGHGRVGGVRTKEGERIDCQLVGLTPGVSPNLDLVEGTSIETGRGILVDEGLRTNVDGIYAAGDCAEIRTPGEDRNLLQQVWYTGRAQGRLAGEILAGEDRRYEPATWFNSAKFLDIEYQTYGRVGFHVPGEKHLYWEHPDGRRSLRLVYTDEGVIGFNLMGMRHRHRVCERWVDERRSVDHVLEHLDQANFDPEFYERHEQEIATALRSQHRRQQEGSPT